MPDSPLQAHSASPAELRERIEAERAGRPFLVLREGGGAQQIVDLDGFGTRVSVRSCPLQRDLAAVGHGGLPPARELECIGGEWTVSDDGLSRNGTYVNGGRISGRHRLRDGDVLRVGRTAIAFRRPATEDSMRRTWPPPCRRSPSWARPSGKVLVALARPYKHDEFASPATNQTIAGELHLSVDAVKAHLRGLFQRFGIEHLPQNQKRSRLVAEALQSGVISTRDL
jgi:DNA-binding CsgD family transcriptional regulator